MDNKSAEAIDHEYRDALIVAACYEDGDLNSIEKLMGKRALLARAILANEDPSGELKIHYDWLSDKLCIALGIAQRS